MGRVLKYAGPSEAVLGGLMTAWPELIPRSVGIVLIFLGVITFIHQWRKGSYESLRSDRWVRMWDFSRRDWLPFRKVIPIGEASRIAYEKLRHTKVEKKAEGLNKDNVLGYYYHALIGMDYVQIFGCRPPSTKIKPVLASELKGRGSFSDDGNSFTEYSEKKPKYEKLSIRKVDLNRYIKEHRD